MPNLLVGEKHLKSIFQKGQLLYFQKDEIILPASDIATHFYWIESGLIRSFVITPSGERNVYVIYKHQEFFPWWLFKNTGHTNIGLFYEAKTRVSLRKVSKDSILDAMNKDPHLSYAVLQQVLRFTEVFGILIKSRGYRLVRDRVRYYLYFLASRYGRYRRESGEIFIDAPITHQDIASSLGTTRETVTREIQSLIRENIIDQEGHFIVVKDYKKLKLVFDE
jgi:CRP/FNR family transcriptional regulator